MLLPFLLLHEPRSYLLAAVALLLIKHFLMLSFTFSLACILAIDLASSFALYLQLGFMLAVVSLALGFYL